MRILAIETSCDETAICILEAEGSLPLPKFTILGNALLSQTEVHAEFGGVYPMLAKREHIKNLPVLLKKVLLEAAMSESAPEVDCIAVTAGPGLEPALWTGIEFAKSLGERWSKSVVPVNHMHGHLFSTLYQAESPIEFPAIALLVSGGHTELVHMESFESYKVIGETRDDAVGEAFDKVARLLGLPYPGGPAISLLASSRRAKHATASITFPQPMINSDDYNFSYSGLKTAVLYTIKKLAALDESKKEEIARAFEDAAIGVLVEKTRRALDEFGAKTLLVGGGVSANRYLRAELENLAESVGVDLRLPAQDLSTDNAIMIGMAAYVRLMIDPSLLTANADIKAEGKLAL